MEFLIVDIVLFIVISLILLMVTIDSDFSFYEKICLAFRVWIVLNIVFGFVGFLFLFVGTRGHSI